MERLGQRPPLACMFWLLQVGSTINTSNTITSGTISNITLEKSPQHTGLSVTMLNKFYTSFKAEYPLGGIYRL